MYTPKFELLSFASLPTQRKQIVLRAALEFLIVANWNYILENQDLPSLYDFAPQYVLKVRPSGLDSWQDIPQTIALSSGDCFAEGTLIRTARGDIPIENVQIGDEVATKFGWNKVLNQGCTKLNASTLELETDRGSKVSATPGHMFWTPNRGWTPLEELRAGDSIIELNGDDASVETRVKNISESPRANVYDLTVKDRHEFFANGVNGHNCKDFACWRVAELRHQGYDDVYPHIKVSYHPDPNGREPPMTVYHIQVRIHEHIEDPSAILGMPEHVTYEQLRA